MIELSQIKVNYGSGLFDNAGFKVPLGRVTAITGPSGSGKTTLLYLLGLISSVKNYSYVYNGKKISTKKTSKMDAFRRRHIAFVFQDHMLPRKLKIRDLLWYAANLSGIGNTNDLVDQTTALMKISKEKLNLCLGRLSGGERLKAAFAFALCKKTDILLLDEPFSLLDSEEVQAMQLVMRKLAEEGRTVIYTTNRQDNDFADVCYRIENKQLVMLKGQDLPDAEQKPLKNPASRKQKRFATYFRYNRKTMQNRSGGVRFVYGLCALAFSCLVVISCLLSSLISSVNATANAKMHREIMVVGVDSNEEAGSVIDSSRNVPLSSESKAIIEKTEGVYALFPFASLPNRYLYGDPVGAECRTICIQEENTEQKIELAAANAAAEYTVMPWNDIFNESLELKSGRKNEDGAYISVALARELGLLNWDGSTELTLTLSVGVPVKTLVFADQSYSTYYTSFTLELRISGILAGTSKNVYNSTGSGYILIPQSRWQEILVEAEENFSEEALSETTKQLNCKAEEWQPGTALVYVKEDADIQNIVRNLNEQDTSVRAECKYEVSSEWKTALAEMLFLNRFVLITVTFLFLILVGAVFIARCKSREKEYAFLVAQGMTERELIGFVMSDGLLQGLSLFARSLIPAILEILIISVAAMDVGITTWLNSLVLLFFSCMISVNLPVLLYALFRKKVCPADVFRY